MSEKNKTSCPNCGVDIDVNELLYTELEKQAQSKYQQQLKSEQARISERESSLDELANQLQAQEQSIQKLVDKQLQDKLSQERLKITNELESEQATRIKAMETELDNKSKKLVELNQAQAEVTRLKRESQELQSRVTLQLQEKFDQQLKAQSTQLQKELTEVSQFKVAEKEQIINQLKDQLSQAQRKADQGSMQIQGEVQELAIEQWLTETFVLDEIQEIKKGAQGGDTLQIIHTREQQNCGTIYYESKRTKAFQPGWIAKFKDDIQQKNADVGVLVTQVMPNDMESLGQIDGVWICTFAEFKNLSQVLRESIIQLNTSLNSQENKGDKMHMLYDFLTGNEFRMQIESIVEGFSQLQNDLVSEKRAMQSIWKKREKQIERVLLNTNFMYSSIKGIAGNSIQPISQLELKSQDED